MGCVVVWSYSLRVGKLSTSIHEGRDSPKDRLGVVHSSRVHRWYEIREAPPCDYCHPISLLFFPNFFDHIFPEYADLLVMMLNDCQEERISIKQVLQSPWCLIQNDPMTVSDANSLSSTSSSLPPSASMSVNKSTALLPKVFSFSVGILEVFHRSLVCSNRPSL
jgi:hypothetical protein